MKHAWIENDRIRDICPGDPAECYHPDIAQFYNTLVPDDAENGDGWVNGQLVKPTAPPPAPPAPPPAPEPRRVSPVEFKLLFTAQERVAIRAVRDTDPVIDDFFDILDDPRLTSVDLTSSTTRGMVDYLVSKAFLTAKRRDEIVNGRP